MDLREIKDNAEDLSNQTGVFANLCEFVYYGTDYMDRDKNAEDRLFSMLKLISQEAKRIEQSSDELYDKIFKIS